MSRGYLTKIDFDAHELWEKLHCRDQSAFLESKTCQQLLAMTRQRGIRDEQVFSYGQSTHKKTYIAALRETYLIDLVATYQTKHTSQDSLVHIDVFNSMKMKFEASTGALELLEEEMSELKTTNRALYRHVNKMSKKLEGFKQRTTPQALESLEMDKMEEAEQMCNALSSVDVWTTVKLADMTKKRDNESRKVESLETKVESLETRLSSVTKDWLLSTNNVSRLTKKVYTLQSRIEELTEASVAFSRIFKKRRRE